jgi:prepilin-type processing-associated H-X9-DG protein
LPINLIDDTAKGTGRNDGAFWYQSRVRLAEIRDGTSFTSVFSERCLGNSAAADLLGDVYLIAPTMAGCEQAGPTTTPRYDHSLEWSGQRWADGNAFYTRYHHLLTPGKPSCTTGIADTDGDLAETATSRHPGGVNLMTADGSVRFVKNTIAPAPWKALATIAGGEIEKTE